MRRHEHSERKETREAGRDETEDIANADNKTNVSFHLFVHSFIYCFSSSVLTVRRKEAHPFFTLLTAGEKVLGSIGITLTLKINA